MTTHEDLCAIPTRVTTLERQIRNLSKSVAELATADADAFDTIAERCDRLEQTVADLVKQVAGLRQQQTADATAIDLLRREARR